MSSPRSLTGRWVGHYSQHAQSHPIVATLHQAEDRLTGSMQDVRTEGECSLFDATAAAGLPPGADEEIEAKLRELVPGAPAEPVRYAWHLPPDSALDGRLAGSRVYFLKTYHGKSVSGFRVGSSLVGSEAEDHSVHYEGELRPDGDRIEGRWWIEADPSRGTQRTEGAFELRRWGESTEPPARDEAPARRTRAWWKFWSR
jgi:hypothetical protein